MWCKSFRPQRRPLGPARHAGNLGLLGLLAGVLLTGCGPRHSLLDGGRIAPDDFMARVAWLAHDDRAGRLTGSDGFDEAAAYVAQEFALAGLQPLGEGDTFHDGFWALGRRELRSGNELVLAGTDDGGQDWVLGPAWELGEDWVPFRTALRARRRGGVVFAGYGLIDAEQGWDDYAGLDVRGQVAVVLRGGPGLPAVAAGDSAGAAGSGVAGPGTGASGAGLSEPAGAGPPGPFTADVERRRELSTFARKIDNAYARGATALLVINQTGHLSPGGEADELQSYGPIGVRGWSASLPAAHLTATVGAVLMAAVGHDLGELQARLDRSDDSARFALEDVRAFLSVRSGRRRVRTANVVGALPGADPALSGECIVVAAHLDHLGLGLAAGTRGGSEAEGQVHNGADDNASGVAGLVEIARLLAARDQPLARSVVFVAFSAEEWGLLGSEHLLARPLRNGARPVAMVNMDMIGRSRDGYVLVEGVGSSPALRPLVVEAHRARGAPLDLHVAEQTEGHSDHGPFLRRGVPAINVFSGHHDDYHTPSDDASKVNAETGAVIAEFVAEIVARLASEAQAPEFAPASRPERPVSGGDGLR